jgi:hypothetical protein
MINRRNVIQLLSYIPLIGIGKLKASEVSSRMKDVVDITVTGSFQLEQVFTNDPNYVAEVKPTRYEVRIQWNCGGLYKFVGRHIKFDKNVCDLGYQNPLYPKKIYHEILDFTINRSSVTIITNEGKITVS